MNKEKRNKLRKNGISKRKIYLNGGNKDKTMREE
jgi:hypothetical protein